jgi:hypothetical protein
VEAGDCRRGDSHNVSLELTPRPALARSAGLVYTVDREATAAAQLNSSLRDLLW